MGWESEEFNTIDLGDKCLDKRLDKRAVLLAERMAASPSKSIPGACQGRTGESSDPTRYAAISPGPPSG